MFHNEMLALLNIHTVLHSQTIFSILNTFPVPTQPRFGVLALCALAQKHIKMII